MKSWLASLLGRKQSRRLRPVLSFEELDPRETPSVIPFGSEFQVNTFTTGDQTSKYAAMDAQGDFVIVWTSYGGQDGSGLGIFAQRYNAGGVRQGGEFQVNTFTSGNQNNPRVAMDAAGDFVISWESANQDGSGYGVFAQRYNAAGVAEGGEFQVNTFTTNNQSRSSVAMDSTGDFVIAWQSTTYGVMAQRYNAAGQQQGGEFKVDTGSGIIDTGDGGIPATAMDSAGDFVITWSVPGSGVVARRYNAAGQAQGAQFLVDSVTAGSQWPSVAMDPAGDFVVAWHVNGADGSGYGVLAQRYNAAGIPQDSIFQVNTYTTGPQGWPHVAMDAAGDFVINWDSIQDGSSYGIYAQRYNAAGVRQGSEFQVNTYTTNLQSGGKPAMDAAGDFVIAWGSSGEDGSGKGIFAQQYVNLGPNWQASPPAGHRFLYRRQVSFPLDNAAVSVGASFDTAQVTGQSFLAPTLQANVDASQATVGLFAREQSNGDAYVAVLTNSGMAQILLFHGASDTYSLLGFAAAGTNAGALTFTVTGTGTGTTLSLSVNGGPPLLVTNSAQTTLDSAGSVGLFAAGANGLIDNFSVSGS
jgi:hypothetical protein